MHQDQVNDRYRREKNLEQLCLPVSVYCLSGGNFAFSHSPHGDIHLEWVSESGHLFHDRVWNKSWSKLHDVLLNNGPIVLGQRD